VSDDGMTEAVARAHAARRGGVWDRWEELDGTPTPLVDANGEKLPNLGTQRALRRRLALERIAEDAR